MSELIPESYFTDYVYVFLKVGNQETALGKEYKGMRNGMIVDMIDEREWKKDIKDIISRTCLTRYACLKVDRAKKGFFLDALKQDGVPEQSTNYWSRKKAILWDDLQTALGKPNLFKDLQSHKYVPILDGTQLPDTIYKLSKTIDFGIVPDFNQITIGNATVGAGGTYATWVLAWADLGNLTGDLTFTQITATIEGAQSIITETLGGFTLLCTSNNPHNGTPFGGYSIDDNFNNTLWLNELEGPGTLEFRFLYFRRIINKIVSSNRSFMLTQNTITGYTFILRDCFEDGQNFRGSGFLLNDSDITLSVFDNVIWNMSNVGLAGFGVALYVNGTDSDIIENNTLYSCTEGLNAFNSNINANSNACIDNTTDFVNIGAAAGNNNADSDGTGANGNWAVGADNQINIVPAVEFESLLDTVANFVKVTNAGVCGVGGLNPTTIAGNDHGNRTNARPGGDAAVSIGADELEEPEVAVTPTAVRRRRQQYWHRMMSHHSGI